MSSSHPFKKMKQIQLRVIATLVGLTLCQMDICEHRQIQQDLRRDCPTLYFQKQIRSYLCSRILVKSWLISRRRYAGNVGIGITNSFQFSFEVADLPLFLLKIDGKLLNLKKDVSLQDSKHRKTLTEVSQQSAYILC